MTLGDILSGGFLAQSIGVVGLVFGRKSAAQEPPQTRQSELAVSSTPGRTRREDLRASNGVRLITPQQEGCALAHLPDGVYGFTYSPIGETPLFSGHAYHSFEVHKPASGGARVIAFVTPSDAAALRDARSELVVRLYPDAWENATEPVELAIDRLTSRKMHPSREPGTWLEVTLHPAQQLRGGHRE